MLTKEGLSMVEELTGASTVKRYGRGVTKHVLLDTVNNVRDSNSKTQEQVSEILLNTTASAPMGWSHPHSNSVAERRVTERIVKTSVTENATGKQTLTISELEGRV